MIGWDSSTLSSPLSYEAIYSIAKEQGFKSNSYDKTKIYILFTPNISPSSEFLEHHRKNLILSLF